MCRLVTGLIRLLSLMLIIGSSGCVVPPLVPLADRSRASQLIDQGTEQLRAGNLPQAKASFSVSYELFPSAAALDGLGCVAVLSGEFDTAEQLFQYATQQDPSYLTVHSNHALLLELRGDNSRAKQIYEYVIREQPDEFKARNNFAALLYDRYSEEESLETIIRELRKAEALAPHPVIIENLDRVEGGDE